MSTVYLVTGGARSGKSSYAEELCQRLSPNPIYLATSQVYGKDVDFANRILKHQQTREGKSWTTIEEPLRPSKCIQQMVGNVVLVDCLTLWLTNWMMEEGVFTLKNGNDDDREDNGNTASTKASIDDDDSSKKATQQREASERALMKVQEEFDTLTSPWNCVYVFVTNELGSGTHAHDHVTRKFVDAQGWLNQYVAKRATKVIHMVCGCPTIIKETMGDPKSSSSSSSSLHSIPTHEQAQTAAMLDEYLSKRGLEMDKKGYFLVKVDRNKQLIRVSFHSCIVNEKGEFFDLDGNKLTCDSTNSPEPIKVWECRTAKEMTMQVLEQWMPAKELVSVGHAGYLGREVQKAETALYNGTYFQQD
jgi:adenosylcobinamide kinase/adenosylcobinamide-phosphate guanylyltransferase